MTRASLLALLAFVALTSIAGGAVMVASASVGTDRMRLPPEIFLPPELLQGVRSTRTSSQGSCWRSSSAASTWPGSSCS
jgi:hypothetical protein